MRRADTVVVVGAGPVGQVLCLLLARAGVRSLLIERWKSPYMLPRAVAMSHESLRILRGVGFAGEDLLEPWGDQGQEFLFQGADGEVLLRSTFELDSESGYAQMYAFSQPQLEVILSELVADDPLIDVLRGWSVTELEQSADEVLITAVEHDGMAVVEGGQSQRFSAPFVVGCDGANSAIRSLLSIPLDQKDFSHRWFVVDVDPKPGTESPLNSMVYAAQHLDPSRPTTLISAGPQRRRFEFMVMPEDTDEDLKSDATAWKLLARWGVEPGNANLVRHALYTFTAGLARDWAHGRVVLAGDAAHQMPPFLGQGFNSGIRDAANLAWRLAALVAGGPPQLLADYSTERHGQLEVIIDETVGAGRLICETNPERARIRDARLRKSSGRARPGRATWPIEGGTQRPADPGAGDLSMQAAVDGGARLLDSALPGAGPLLILAPATPDPSITDSLARQWAGIGGRVAEFGADLMDISGGFSDWFEDLGVSAVLVRPDYYVYGSSVGLEGVEALMSDYLAAVSFTEV